MFDRIDLGSILTKKQITWAGIKKKKKKKKKKK